MVDDESFDEVLFELFACLRQDCARPGADRDSRVGELCTDAFAGAELLLDALRAEPLGMEDLKLLADEVTHEGDSTAWLMMWLAHAQRLGVVSRYPDGRFGPVCLASSQRKS